jgi:signal transduction histidine kinase
VEVQFKDKLPPVLGDKVQLQQVILNIVLNALEAMRPVQVRQLLVRSDQLEQGLVKISVADTGPGIDPANIERIFKPLFTTKSRGMGMGLAICHSIVESHGGRIWASPAPGGGSIFQFELPTQESLRQSAPSETRQ